MTILQFAKKLMHRRKFGDAIRLLQSNYDGYKGTFEYYLILGISCLYVGDIGNARQNFDQARSIKVENVDLYLGQAAIFLNESKIDRALEYYVDVIGMDPKNKIAASAMDFIKNLNGDDTPLKECIETGKIVRFYPALGINPAIIRNGILVGFAFGALISCAIVLFASKTGNLAPKPPAPSAFSEFELTEEEKAYSGLGLPYVASGTSAPASVKDGVRTGLDIQEAYKMALEYVSKERDNAARVELNSILLSEGVLPSIRAKAEGLFASLQIPTFDSLSDNFSVETVLADPSLYSNCYVIWDGRIANLSSSEDGSLRFDLLVGYENYESVKAWVPVLFGKTTQREFDTKKPIRVLGRVGEVDGHVVLFAQATYQPLHGDSLADAKLQNID